MKFKIIAFDFQNMTVEVEEIKDQARQKKVKKPEIELAQVQSTRSDIWAAYESAYESRYRTKPVRNAKTNSIVMNLEKRLGSEAPAVVDFFVRHNDGFYVKSCHPLSLCLRDAEGLVTQMRLGVTVTGTKVREFEKKEKLNETLEWVTRGGLGSGGGQ